MPNTNPKTGLPFGVINGSSLDPGLLDHLYTRACAKVYDMLIVSRRAQLRRQIVETLDELFPDCATIEECSWFEDLIAEHLEVEAERGDFGHDEPSAEFTYEGVTVHYSYLGGAPIVFSYDGPVTHVAAYCSPCVPGAADLNSGPGDIACHGVPEDWLDKGGNDHALLRND